MCGWHRVQKHIDVPYSQRINKHSLNDEESKCALMDRRKLAVRHDQPHVDHYEMPLEGCTVIEFFKQYEDWFVGNNGDILRYYVKFTNLTRIVERDWCEAYSQSTQNHKVNIYYSYFSYILYIFYLNFTDILYIFYLNVYIVDFNRDRYKSMQFDDRMCVFNVI